MRIRSVGSVVDGRGLLGKTKDLTRSRGTSKVPCPDSRVNVSPVAELPVNEVESPLMKVIKD